jgi:hypothetical protein
MLAALLRPMHWDAPDGTGHVMHMGCAGLMRQQHSRVSCWPPSTDRTPCCMVCQCHSQHTAQACPVPAGTPMGRPLDEQGLCTLRATGHDAVYSRAASYQAAMEGSTAQSRTLCHSRQLQTQPSTCACTRGAPARLVDDTRGARELAIATPQPARKTSGSAAGARPPLHWWSVLH